MLHIILILNFLIQKHIVYCTTRQSSYIHNRIGIIIITATEPHTIEAVNSILTPLYIKYLPHTSERRMVHIYQLVHVDHPYTQCNAFNKRK